MNDTAEKPSPLPSLKKIREKQGLTQTELARRAGLASGMTVSRLEVGFTSDPMLATVIQIAEALGVSIEDLLRVPRH